MSPNQIASDDLEELKAEFDADFEQPADAPDVARAANSCFSLCDCPMTEYCSDGGGGGGSGSPLSCAFDVDVA